MCQINFYPQKDLLLLFYPLRDEKELLSGFPPIYQNELQKEGVQDVVNINKMKFEPYGGLVDQTFLQTNGRPTIIKTHIAKLKMIKHHGQSIPMKVIQKKEKQKKLLHFQISCYKHYQIMKSQKV